jgi:hypothetical protein
VKERDAAAAAIDAEVFAGVVPPPMQAQIQRMGGMSSAVIGGFCEHSPVIHELVAKFADMTAKETAKEGARVAAQRGHITPDAPHNASGWPQGHGATSTKNNHVPVLLGPHHRVRTHASPPATYRRRAGRTADGGEGSQEKQSAVRRPYALGDLGRAACVGRREWAARQRRATCHMPYALWRRPPSPAAAAAQAAGGAVGAPRRGRFAHGESSGGGGHA